MIYRKNKRKLSFTVILFFMTTLFYNLVPVAAYADTTSTTYNEGPYSITLTTTPAQQGGKVQINAQINVENTATVQNGGVKIQIPNSISNVTLNGSGLTGYFNTSQDGNNIILNPTNNIGTLINATFSMQGTLSKNAKTGNYNIPIIINGHSVQVPISVSTPGGSSSGSSATPGGGSAIGGGGYTPPPPKVNGLNGVNLDQPIGKYFTPENIGGKFTNTQTITNVNGGNCIVNYTAFINTQHWSGDVFTDTLPEGMTYVPGSMTVVNIYNPSNSVGVNMPYMPGGTVNLATNGNQVILSGFSNIAKSIYQISYQCKISLAYAQKVFDKTLQNKASFAGATSTANLTINTEKTHFDPSLENGILKKTVNEPVFQDGTKVLSYKLAINPKNAAMENVKVVDKLPEGLKLQPLDTNVYSPNYDNVTIITQDKSGSRSFTKVNLCEIDANGQKSYPFGEQAAVIGTLYYNMQNNSIELDIPSTQDQVFVKYNADVQPGAKNIANIATISNNGLNSSSTAVSQYASASTSVGMWKTAYWMNNGTKVESTPITNNQTDLNINGANNPDVTFVIHVSNNNSYFPDGQLTFRDPIQDGVKILNVKTPDNIGYSIKDNVVYFKNTKYVEPGNFDVEITCSLANIKGGSTVQNVAYKGGWGSDKVIVHKKSNTVEQQKGSLTITKEGINGTKLEGAEFTVTGANGFSKVVTTNTNGVASLNELPEGTYTVKETKAPIGYTLNTKEQTVVIGKQSNGSIILNQNISVQDNTVLGAIKVMKTDAQTGKPLQGATFTATNGSKVYTEVTDKNGVAEFTNLPWGNYSVKETVAPNGYTINPEVKNVTINEESFSDAGTFKEPIFNIKDSRILGSLQIVKTGINNIKLAGAEFTVTGPDGFSKVVTTDKNGVANLDDLAWGTYSVKETKAPVGYNLNETVQTVKIDANDAQKLQTVTVNDAETTGTLEISKTDITNEKEVAGAKIEITGTSLNGQKIDKTFVSGLTPTKFTLPAGTYTYKEVDAPVGYNINTTVGHFTISTQGQIVKADVKDSRILGQLSITKTGKDGVKLEGAEFTVTGPNRYSKVVTTDKNGVANLNDLPWGTYTVKETKAPVGYSLNSQAQTVVIDANDATKVQAVNVSDTQILGQISITKTNETNEKEVAGAKIEITGTSFNGQKVDKTFVSGLTPTKFTLPAGTYTYKEVDAPVGYNINTTVGHFTISRQGQIVKATVKDSRVLGSLQIVKTGINNIKLAGAEFTVTGPNGFSKVVKTDKNGVANLNDLAWGTYSIKETKAPAGYNLNETVQTVKIDANDAQKLQTVTVNDEGITGTLEISKTDITNEKEVAGAKIEITGTSLNGQKIDKTFVSGLTPTKFTLPAGTYTYKEVDAPVGYNINTTVGHFTISRQGQIVKATVKDSRVLGSLQIVKTGINNIKLAGAEFTVTGPNGFSKVVKTDKNGVANLNDLAWGTYSIKETKAPAGYNLNETVQTVKIDANDAQKLQTVTVKDAETTGTLEISKTDITNEKEVAGAKIEITGTSLNGQKIDKTFVSGLTPTKFTLPAGTYTYKEVDAPVGYNINTTVGHFTISTQGQIVKADVKDSRILGQLSITKTGKDGVKLEGAEFTVTGPNGFSKMVTTDKNGVANLNDLPWGTYTVKETKAPVGYSLNSQAQTVVIDANDATKVQAANVNDTQILGQMSIIKTNESGTETLEGAQYTVTGPNGFNKVVTTDKNGVANLKDLAWGTYTVKETKAPVGYNINPAVQTVTIDAANVAKLQNVTQKDVITTGTLEIEKTDVTNEKEVAGAKIQITGTSVLGKKIDISFTSGLTPTKFTLPAGTYTYKEVDAPVGYEINTTVGHFTIDKQGQIVKADVKDNRILGQMSITKTNESGTEKLEGAQYTVTGPNGFNKVVTTDKNGVANLKDLAWGTYSVKETKAPVGYNINSAVQTVTIDAANVAKLQNVTQKDVITTGTLEIEKTDVTNEKEVAGAKIQITGTSVLGKKIDISFTSGLTPTKFTLPAGTYTYKEVDAPVGYEINTTVGHFTIDKQGQIVKADVKDNRLSGNITIVKTNESGTKNLQGAQFTITGPNGFNKVVTTDNNGVASLSNLAWGTYSIKETRAPAGYNLNPEVESVTINAKNVEAMHAITVKDSQIIKANLNASNSSNKENGSQNGAESPKTGDSSQLPIYVLLIAAIVGLVGVNRKNKKKVAN